MKVKIGDTVKVEYEGFFDNGEVFDSTTAHDGEPLEFKVGEHQVVSGFENAVIGKELNQQFQIRLEPEDAYGPHDPNSVHKIPREEFPADLKPEVGMMLVIEQTHGDHSHQIPVVIKEVNEDEISLDFNHPMAGKTLNFKMKVVQIN
ncbi:MAG: peptidylprolyl isomerase [Candidatus Lokiarchaeota archaeon]|nr:peptidylprolyl isomerase [Candidatus Lokiarchaeota archaeon]